MVGRKTASDIGVCDDILIASKDENYILEIKKGISVESKK
jgi:hypothetical protein